MDRRKAPRRLVGGEEALSRARLRTGGQLLVLDASAWGALTESTERLLPGRHLDVHVVSVQGRVLVRSRVARAFVWRLEGDRVTDRGALAVDRAHDVWRRGHVLPLAGRPAPNPPGRAYPPPA